MSSESFPATNERTGYVAVTRGKEQVQIFTDDRAGLLKAVSRPDAAMSATELSEAEQKKRDIKHDKRKLRGGGLMRPGVMQPDVAKNAERGSDYER
jgi:DNA helicase TraI